MIGLKMLRKGSGMLRGLRLITGASTKVPKGLKPQKSRELIRRFHNLLKWKLQIVASLAKEYPEIDQDNYRELLGKQYSRHVLEKRDVKANSKQVFATTGTTSQLAKTLAQIDAEIEWRGGLETYQRALTQGQDAKRGGDSSKKLVQWLELGDYLGFGEETLGLRALEIGCLLSLNAISFSHMFSSVVKIDLHSQSPEIIEQDFMQRPLPTSDAERFNLISCSLVLNFVPTPSQRGEMLRRTTQFLLPPTAEIKLLLFLVLPLPCVSNSRYCTGAHLDDIMKSLGYNQVNYHEATKVAYWLYEWTGPVTTTKFPKRELQSGANRNNFAVVMD